MQNYVYSAHVVELVKKFEGLRLKAYRCPAGRLTVGYGHTGNDLKGDTEITPTQAAHLLRQDLEALLGRLNRLLPKGLKQGQVDALTSFAFNLGVGALAASTLLRKVRANPSDPSIAEEFLRWNRCRGKTLRGLTLRRRAEAALYSDARPVASNPTETTAATHIPTAI